MDKETKTKLIERMSELEYRIAIWSSTNSQSNPGAVMELRDMKRELAKIKKELGL